MNDLDKWAQEFGYANFDTYTNAGGSRTEAFAHISKRIRRLQSALDQLLISRQSAAARETKPGLDLPDVAEADVDSPDTANAQIQGADHVV
jgi:hypothetical protein